MKQETRKFWFLFCLIHFIGIAGNILLYHLYLAGAFNTVIWCFKEIAKDFNEFRKI